jgi:transposase
VQRYLRGGPAAEAQERPSARRLDGTARLEAVALFDGVAEGAAVVVAEMLAQRGVEASARIVQRAVAERRREQVAAALATVRFETAPGRQMQIDFGERRVWIAGEQVTVHFLAAVPSYSRRMFVKAFLHERQGEWLDGIASALRCTNGRVVGERRAVDVTRVAERLQIASRPARATRPRCRETMNR